MPRHSIIDDPLFNAALAKTQTSTHRAVMIVVPAPTAAGVNVDKLSRSHTSLMHSRNNSREILAAEVRQSFQRTSSLVAHFDVKILAYLDETIRISSAIVVSGLDVEKLPDISILPVGR